MEDTPDDDHATMCACSIEGVENSVKPRSDLIATEANIKRLVRIMMIGSHRKKVEAVFRTNEDGLEPNRPLDEDVRILKRFEVEEFSALR